MMDEPKMYLNQEDKIKLFYLLGILKNELIEESFDASTYIAELRTSHFMGDPPFYEKQSELHAIISQSETMNGFINEIQSHLVKIFNGTPLFANDGTLIEIKPILVEDTKKEYDPSNNDLPF